MYHCKVLYAIGMISLIMTPIFSQSLSSKKIKQIDSLYANWSLSNSPGCSIGIVRNDTLIYAKGYGMANLEYVVANTPETIFHIASVSKQFTAWSIILLARQGKLSLEDDVRKYLPWFPSLGAKITIRNLLNHTSGIRDQWQLVATSGTRLDDVITQEQIKKILSKQQGLNFVPGENYSYTSSGYTMLAEIVTSVTGKTFRQFTDSAIFQPLNMTNTHFRDDYTAIEKNRAYSYNRIDSIHFSNSTLSYSTTGATNLLTNIVDMSRWVSNLYDAETDQKNLDTFTKNVQLSAGEKLSYASGIIVNTYRGWKQYAHGGSDAGYRTYMCVLPELKMGFIVFGNVGDFDPEWKAHAMADLFIVHDKLISNGQITDAPEILTDSLTIRKLAGHYIGDDGLPLSFEMKGGKLYYNLFNQRALLKQIAQNSFSMVGEPSVGFLFSAKGNEISVDVHAPDQFYHLKKYTPNSTPSIKLLDAYVGTYFSPELECTYSMVLKGDQLFLTNSKYDSKLTFLNEDHVMNDNWWMSHLSMVRDKKNKLIGFEVNAYGMKHLRFNRTN